MNYTEVEAKVREATNDEQWGPHGSLMQEISQFTYQYEHYTEVMGMLWKRMFPEKKNWRSTYKSLLLLNYLLKHGAEKVVTSAREHLYDLRSLENYSLVDENGKDQGVNIRQRCKEVLEFVQDDDRLREERKKAKKNKEKYVGIQSDGFGGSGGGSSRFDDTYRDKDTYYSNNKVPSLGGNDLDDKDWVSSNPTIVERISDITSKVKNMLESARDTDRDAADRDENLSGGDDDDYNDYHQNNSKKNNMKASSSVFKDNDDDDDGFGDIRRPSTSKTSQQPQQSSNVNLKLNTKPIGVSKTTAVPKIQINTAAKPAQTPAVATTQKPKEIDLLGGDDDQSNQNDDFGDFVSFDSKPASKDLLFDDEPAPVQSKVSTSAQPDLFADFSNFDSKA
jgi:hypothetical protein